MNQTHSGLFLVFGALSADVQQTLRCLIVVNGMFSRPQSAGALEGHRSTMMQTPHESSHESVNDAFHVWIVRVYLALDSSIFLRTSHTSSKDCGNNVWMSSDCCR